MISRVGVVADGTDGHLPADFINPIFAYSLNRKLRYLYDGDWFRFREGDVEKDYPSNTPDFNNEVRLVRIYDQKEKYGVSKVDAVAPSEAEQPILIKRNNLIIAVFEQGHFLEIKGLESLVADEFHILATCKSDYPRPAFGMWGDSQSVTVEPSTEAVGKFTVNRNRGGMLTSTGNTYGCFYGFDASQNKQRVMSVNDIGHNVKTETVASIDNIAIGRKDSRYYNGEVLEVVMHLSDLEQHNGRTITNDTIEYYNGYQ